jgi:hypothetical protein
MIALSQETVDTVDHVRIGVGAHLEELVVIGKRLGGLLSRRVITALISVLCRHGQQESTSST